MILMVCPAVVLIGEQNALYKMWDKPSGVCPFLFQLR